MPDNHLFDELAARYDEQFSFSKSGRLQRERVHRFLRRVIVSGMNVLEINCGTGEDAFFMAGLGCNVLATDDSQKMIDQCVGKLKGRSEEAGVVFKKAGFTELEQFDEGKKYDLVFSNFSGLNCIPAEEITRLSATLSSLLEPRGKMILVVFGTRCGWEIGYRLLRRRGEPPNRRRRNKPVIFGPVDSKTRIYYYSPGIFTRLFSKEFRVRSSRPVGLFLPPSGLDPFFRNRKILLKILVLMEKWFGDISFLSDFADHYLVTFEKR